MGSVDWVLLENYLGVSLAKQDAFSLQLDDIKAENSAIMTSLDNMKAKNNHENVELRSFETTADAIQKDLTTLENRLSQTVNLIETSWKPFLTASNHSNPPTIHKKQLLDIYEYVKKLEQVK